MQKKEKHRLWLIHVGAYLTQLREARRLPLRIAANRAGLTIFQLHQREQGNVDLSCHDFITLARVYGIRNPGEALDRLAKRWPGKWA